MKEAELRAIYSPRTTFSQQNEELDKLTTNLAINIDKYILGFFKNTFENHNDSLCLQQFILMGKKHLKSWQKQLPDRQIKLLFCLSRLFQSASINGQLNWASFNSLLIEKGLTLKSLKSQQSASNTILRAIDTYSHIKPATPIIKMVCMPNKLAILCQQSNRIEMFDMNTMQRLRPIILHDHEQKVQTTVVRKGKDAKKQVHKKQVVVAVYKYSILDMIYIENEKYKMLITSSSDCVVRGWDVTSSTPTIVRQPENEDEKMIHQFPKQMHGLAWDSSNEVLYCSGDDQVIYQWLVKMDSERQLHDKDGHTSMIACMLVMSKLQFLATGGYDGKLILWETISQSKKFVYESHTRSISSIAFHEQLILLFTSAYDHSICVWNPYIPSLVHKIIGTITVLQLEIISNTDFLLALDAQGNIKLREVHKFTLINSFSLNRQDNKIDPSCITKINKRYYFGGLSISAYEYANNDATVGTDAAIVTIKYIPQNFMLYSPIKNMVVVWSLLTGGVVSILSNQAESQITAFEILNNLAVIGDLFGNLSVRKLQNGFLVKRLAKFKTTVSHVLIIQKSFIVAGSQDGQITIFTEAGDLVRSFNVKKLNPSAFIKALSFANNMLVVVCKEIYFVGIEKNKILGRWEGEEIIQTALLRDNLLCITPKLQIIAINLPPHHQKFTKAFSFSPQIAMKAVTTLLVNNKCYVGSQTNQIFCYEVGEQSKSLKFIWKTSVLDTVRHFTYIEREQIIAVLVGNKSIILIACNSGKIIGQLNQRSQVQNTMPVLFLNQQKKIIQVNGQSIIFSTNNQEEELRKVIDPNFHHNIIQTSFPQIQLKRNSHWKIYPNLQIQVNKNIQKIMKIRKNLEKFKDQNIERQKSSINFQVKTAIQVQQKWEKQKQQGEEQIEKTLYQKTWGKFSKEKLKFSKKKMQSININNEQQKQIATTPMFRLGLALKNVNQKDEKAYIFMEKPKKKTSLMKLPRI